MLMRRKARNNTPKCSAVGFRHTGAWHNWWKMKIYKNIRPLKRSNKKVRWRYAAFKKQNKLFLSKASKVMANPAWVNVYIPGYVMPDIQCMIRSISVNNSSKCSNCYWPYAFGVLAVLCVKFVLCYMLGWILEIRCPRQTRRKQPYVLHLLYNNFICWKLHFSFCLAIRLCVKVHFTL